MDAESVIKKLTSIKSNVGKLDEYELFEKDIPNDMTKILDTIIDEIKKCSINPLLRDMMYFNGVLYYLINYRYIIDDECITILDTKVTNHIHDYYKTMITRADCFIITGDNIKQVVCESELHATKISTSFKIKHRNPFDPTVIDKQFANIKLNMGIDDYFDSYVRYNLSQILTKRMFFFAHKYTQALNSSLIV